MRATPVNDVFARNGQIRPDRWLVHDLLAVEQAMQPLAETRCPYLKA